MAKCGDKSQSRPERLIVITNRVCWQVRRSGGMKTSDPPIADIAYRQSAGPGTTFIDDRLSTGFQGTCLRIIHNSHDFVGFDLRYNIVSLGED